METAWRLEKGSFIPDDRIPVHDRGFRYGMSLFETVAVLGGRPLLLDAHWRRLQEDAARMGLALPSEADNALHSRWPLRGAVDGVARLILTAGPGPWWETESDGELRLLFEPRSRPEPSTALAPWALDLQRWNRSSLDGLKTGNYWARLLLMTEAKRKGLREVILADDQNVLISAGLANLFVVDSRGELRTPPCTTGARPGVVREWVLAQSEARESSLALSELEAAQEIFLTNSWIGIQPVSQVAEHRFDVGPVTRRMATKYARGVVAMEPGS